MEIFSSLIQDDGFRQKTKEKTNSDGLKTSGPIITFHLKQKSKKILYLHFSVFPPHISELLKPLIIAP